MRLRAGAQAGAVALMIGAAMTAVAHCGWPHSEIDVNDGPFICPEGSIWSPPDAAPDGDEVSETKPDAPADSPVDADAQ